MSAEDLEIHQVTDAPVNRQYSPLQSSLVDGLEGLLRRGKSDRSKSLPYLMNVMSHPHKEDEGDGGDTDAADHK